MPQLQPQNILVKSNMSYLAELLKICDQLLGGLGAIRSGDGGRLFSTLPKSPQQPSYKRWRTTQRSTPDVHVSSEWHDANPY